MSVTRCHLKVLCSVSESSSPTKGLRGYLLKIITPKEDRVLLRIMRWKSFLSVSRIRVDLIRRTGRPVFARTVRGHLVAAGYRSRRPDWCPRRTPDHPCHHRMLSDRLPKLEPSPDTKVHGANMGPTWVLSAPDGPMLAPWTLLSGSALVSCDMRWWVQSLHSICFLDATPH